MANELTGTTIAFLTANEGIEQIELIDPWQAVIDAGGTPKLIAPEAGTAQGMNHMDKGDTFDVDLTVADADPSQYAALVLPGGVANPDALRLSPEAIRFISAMAGAGKPIAAICHGPWPLIDAGVVQGRTLTSWPSLQTDLRNAGATWVDEECHIDRSGASILITSRKPDDLKAFCQALVDGVEAS